MRQLVVIATHRACLQLHYWFVHHCMLFHVGLFSNVYLCVSSLMC